MLAEILALIADFERHPRRREGRRGQRRQPTTARVCLDAGNEGVSAPGASQLAGSLLRAVTDLPLPKTDEAAILAPQLTRYRGNVG
jgi:hypothetical protein